MNALVDLDNKAEETIERLRSDGFTTFKFKMGAAWSPELRVLRRVRQTYPDFEFRVDGNRRWPPGSLLDRLRDLHALRVHYVEEPTHSASLPDQSDVSIALDESLVDRDANQLSSLCERVPISTFVIKPAAVGGMLRALQLAKLAASLGKDIVVTHFADGPIALAAACELALAIANRPCGLTAHPGLSHWPELRIAQLQGNRAIALQSSGLGFSSQEIDRWNLV